MTDREMLELAAKAAGGWLYDGLDGLCICTKTGGAKMWNPITDDGDALRLAVRLRLDVLMYESEVEVIASHNEDENCACPFAIEPYGPDADAATRLAILRCAAEVGRRMT